MIRKMQGQHFQISICAYNISDKATEGFNPEEVIPQERSRNRFSDIWRLIIYKRADFCVCGFKSQK